MNKLAATLNILENPKFVCYGAYSGGLQPGTSCDSNTVIVHFTKDKKSEKSKVNMTYMYALAYNSNKTYTLYHTKPRF